MKDYLVLPGDENKTNICSTFQNQAKCFTKSITSLNLLNAENESFFDE